MRADRAERAAAPGNVRPPIPRTVYVSARIRSKRQLHMFYFSDVAATKHLAGFAPAGKKTQLVIDQSHDALRLRSIGHASRLVGIHGHRLFAQHSLAMID